MEVIHERCAGIDISKVDVKVTIRVPGTGKRRRSETRTFSLVTSGLLAMRDWLLAEQITVVGMEATGVYWKPAFYLLEHDMECWLLNARRMKTVPGRKTDVKDSEWIAKLVEHGLVRPSFVPPEPIRQLRDLTRYRTEVIRERTREAQRLEKLLEDVGIKLSAVVFDILGVSGRAMLEALIAGERSPHVLADLAKGSMRRKTDTLIEALTGCFTEHHAFLARAMLDRIDACTAMEVRLDERIDAQVTPLSPSHRAPHDHPRCEHAGSPGDPRGDRGRHHPLPLGGRSRLVGRGLPRQQRIGQQTRSRQDPPRGPLAQGRARPGRRLRVADQEHLPLPPVSAESSPAAARNEPWSPSHTRSSSLSGTCSPTTPNTPTSAASTSSNAPAGPGRPDAW
jgi:transposase